MRGLLDSDVLFTHHEGGWRVGMINAMDWFPLKVFRDCPEVQRVVEPLGRIMILEAADGGPMDTWPAGHFGTYLGCTPQRRYKSLYVECLYKWHEMFHKYTWLLGGTHCPPALLGQHESWLDWLSRMIDSELEASFASEVAIYFHIPGLRARTFKHPIWADRYLRNEEYCDPRRFLVPAKMDAAERIQKAYVHRRRILQQGQRGHDDWIEYQVSGYYGTNMRWGEMWADELVGYGPYAKIEAFRAVEAHWSEMSDPEAHAAWLRDITPTRRNMMKHDLAPQYQVPMGRLAKLYGQEVFEPYLKQFGNRRLFV